MPKTLNPSGAPKYEFLFLTTSNTKYLPTETLELTHRVSAHSVLLVHEVMVGDHKQALQHFL
jgi:hypothetical protein